MSAGRFADAVSALRASAEGSAVDAERTRVRILSDLRRQRARRAVMFRWIVPMAAVFAGSTAWAAAAGYLPGSWQAVVAVLGIDKHAGPAAAPALPPATSGNTPIRSIPADIPANPAVIPAPLPAPEPATMPGPTGAVLAPRVALPVPPQRGLLPQKAPAKEAPDGDALYVEAHRLHFADHNPAAALSAWDAYLRAAPRGRFAVEAHYNRALCLVRLGRTEQAKGALEPFASGAFGGYRQTEARALLDALAGAER